MADRFKWVGPYVAHVMDHNTTTPEQAQTEQYLVLRDQTHVHGNMELVKQVEVPTHSSPSEGAVELTEEKQKALAVALAVESRESFIEDHRDPRTELSDGEYDEIVGERFAVMSEIGQDSFDWVEYEQNPTFEAVKEAHDL